MKRYACLIPAIALLPTAIQSQTVPEIVRHFSIYEKRDAYCAWPAIARAANGDLLTLFTRTEEHMGPNGEILLSRSTDNGQTWLPPAIIYDTALDDRESGITTLSDGRLLTHLRTVRFVAENYTRLPTTAYPKETIDRWVDYVQRDDYAGSRDLDRAWQTISDDHGYTWSEPQPGIDSIHGGIELRDGSLLVAAYRNDNEAAGVYTASNAHSPWEKIAEVPSPDPERLRFGEPHILQLASGRVIMLIRATAKPYDDESPLLHLWGTYSDDNGRTWEPAYETPLWGYPPHLLQLADGRILCSYGHRRPPYGQRAATSDDGIAWKKDNEFILRDDAPNGDLGYPVSVELEPGRILTVYYQPNVPAGSNPSTHPPLPNRTKPGILATEWILPDQQPQSPATNP